MFCGIFNNDDNFFSVLFKFIRLYGELSKSLYTLDEDGVVSGTVQLMVGSMIRRGSRPSPFANQPIIIRSDKNFHYSNEALINGKMIQTKTTSPKMPCHLMQQSQVVEDPSMAS